MKRVFKGKKVATKSLGKFENKVILNLQSIRGGETPPQSSGNFDETKNKS